MSFKAEQLYALLPAVYRIRDAAEGEPLRAFLSVIAEQVAVLEEDLAQLYDDQFIETCAEWVVPYIGDLVAARGLFVFPNAAFSQRAQVANTLAYRRRKGTAAVLEQLARDVTGWNASVVEYFQFLGTTQYLNHLRLEHLSVTSLRRRSFTALSGGASAERAARADKQQWHRLEYLNTPFDGAARTAEVRRIENRRGKFNIPNIGIFLWRLDSYSCSDSPAYQVDDRRYFFNPLGRDTPLCTLPETEDQISHLATPLNVPIPIGRRVLDRHLRDYYGDGKSLLLNVDGSDIDVSKVTVCDLSDDGAGWAHRSPDHYLIDPVLGRLALPEGLGPSPRVRVTFHYGFSAEMGGGEYGRGASFISGLKPVVRVPSEQPTIQDAIDALAASGGVVEIENNEYFVETPLIQVATGKAIELRAADERRPIVVLDDDLEIIGGQDAEVTLNGLLIAGGRVRVPATDSGGQENQLRRLRLRHCTLLPGASPAILSVPAQPATARLILEVPDATAEIDRCIVGGIRAVDGAKVTIANSIVDATAEDEVAYAGLDDEEPGATLKVENSTIIGRVATLVFELASNTIFLARPGPLAASSAPVWAERLQEGCVRFSYVPPESHVPRRYRCQPANAADAARVRPVFTSQRYGDAGYCQLSARCAIEIREGADDAAEMGAFHDLYQPQREANLRARLAEYLRFGLEAGVFYAS